MVSLILFIKRTEHVSSFTTEIIQRLSCWLINLCTHLIPNALDLATFPLNKNFLGKGYKCLQSKRHKISDLTSLHEYNELPDGNVQHVLLSFFSYQVSFLWFSISREMPCPFFKERERLKVWLYFWNLAKQQLIIPVCIIVYTQICTNS